MPYVCLALAIICEVVATSALKASEEFTRLGPSLLVVAGYGLSFYLLTFAFRTIPVGIAYAIWSGVGVVLVAVVSAFLFKQVPDAWGVVGMALIIAGVVVLNLLSKTSAH